MWKAFSILYVIVGLGVSLFYGIFVDQIWIFNNWKDKNNYHKFWQHFLNFLGGIYGFGALYYLLHKLHLRISTNLGDVFILLIAIMGTMGLLPLAMDSLARNINKAWK